MQFSDKLDTLLSLTGTSNACLANAVHIDRSQISRMRTGARERPKKSDSIQLMAHYFAKHISGYQISALEKLTNDVRVHMDSSEETLSSILFDWLRTDQETQPKGSAERFLYQVQQMDRASLQRNDASYSKEPWLPKKQDHLVYYGNAGKRQAVLDFYHLVLSLPTKSKLLIASDERNNWFFEDSQFPPMMSDLLLACVHKGVTCTHVLSACEDLDGAMYAVEQWLPGFAHGAVRQYYYPLLRDKLYRRTLYILPGVAALTSFSMTAQGDSGMTTLTTIPEIIDIYTNEFSDLLSLCKPLITVYTTENYDKLFSRVETLFTKSAESIYKFSSLSKQTLPYFVMERICDQINTPIAERAKELHLLCIQSHLKILEQTSSIHIMTLAPMDQVRQGTVPIPDWSVFSTSPCYYTKDEYKAHVRSIIQQLERYPNYQVILSDQPSFDSLIMYVMGQEVAIIVKKDPPFVMFEINEPRFTSTFVEFLSRFAATEQQKRSKPETIRLLKEYANRI